MTRICTEAQARLSAATYSMRERLRDETGQTAAEYLGILILVAAIIVAIFSMNIDDDIKTAVQGAIDKVINADGGGGQPPAPQGP
jgi:Flp pilus assembly pilin Flp